MAFANHIRVDVKLLGQENSATAFTTRLWYLLEGGDPVLSALPDYTDEIEEFLRAEIVATLTTGCYFAGVDVRWQIGAAEYFMTSTNAYQAGTVSGTEELPEEDCVVFRRQTGDNARNRRGRMFWPLVPESFQDAGYLSAAGITAYTSLVSAFADTPTGSSLSADSISLTPVQPDFKTGTLYSIVQWKLVYDLANRRDRRTPKKARYVGVTSG